MLEGKKNKGRGQEMTGKGNFEVGVNKLCEDGKLRG